MTWIWCYMHDDRQAYERMVPQVGLFVWVILIVYYLGTATRSLRKRPYMAFRYEPFDPKTASAINTMCCAVCVLSSFHYQSIGVTAGETCCIRRD